jgi:Sulfotransferase family
VFEALDHRVQRRMRELQGAVNAAQPDPVIAFVHIPKTAGATVTSMFAAAYSRNALHKAGNYLRNAEMTAKKVSRGTDGWAAWQRLGVRVSVGHVPYNLFRSNLPEGTRYMTFLREPVDRVLSHYYRHIRREDPRRVGVVKRRPGARIKADSIEQALLELRMPQVNNLATRFLCGHEALGELPDTALDDAKENLRGFAFVGIQERFEESIVLLQRMLGLGAVPYVDRHVSLGDARPAVDQISDDERALIAECNRLDAELYRFGLGLFEESVAEAGEGFAAEVNDLRVRDRAARERAWWRTVEPTDPRAQ